MLEQVLEGGGGYNLTLICYAGRGAFGSLQLGLQGGEYSRGIKHLQFLTHEKPLKEQTETVIL